MELTLTIWLTAELGGCEAIIDSKIAITAEHNLTKEDLDEFVHEQCYADYKAYFEECIDDQEYLDTIFEYVESGKVYLVEREIETECHDKARLQSFLLNKYQEKLLANFMKEIRKRCADFNVEA